MFKKDEAFHAQAKTLPEYEIEKSFEELVFARASEEIPDFYELCFPWELESTMTKSEFYSAMEKGKNIFSIDEALAIIRKNTLGQSRGEEGFLDLLKNNVICTHDGDKRIIIYVSLTIGKKWRLKAEVDNYPLVAFQKGLRIFMRNSIR